jgi:hypothetical protein
MSDREWENRRAWDRGDREWNRDREVEWDRNRERRSYSDRDWENRETGERRYLGDRTWESPREADWRSSRDVEVTDRPRYRDDREAETYPSGHRRSTIGQTWGQQAYSSVGSYGGGLMNQPQGSHAGKGPKNWRRSDERVLEDVNEVLTRDPHVDATDIEVSVSNGEVTLDGTVNHRNEKHHAEDCIWQVTGVREVNNHIRVRQTVGGVISSVFKDDQSR